MIRLRQLFPYLIAPLLLLAAAIFAPQIAPCDPYAQDLGMALRAPDGAHLLGTDRYGRDVLSRVILGAQTTICTSLLLVTAVAAIGCLIGALAGLRGGRTGALLMRIADSFLAFPEMVFAIAAAGALGGGLVHAALALALIGWPKYARLARSLVMPLRSQPYIEAARMNGTGTCGMLWHHVLPNMAGPVIVTAVLDIGSTIMQLAGLSFLGLGAQPPLAEWGAMMNSGRSMLQAAPWTILAPGGAIFFTVSAFNILGDALRDWLDPKQATQKHSKQKQMEEAT